MRRNRSSSLLPFLMSLIKITFKTNLIMNEVFSIDTQELICTSMNLCSIRSKILTCLQSIVETKNKNKFILEKILCSWSSKIVRSLCLMHLRFWIKLRRNWVMILSQPKITSLWRDMRFWIRMNSFNNTQKRVLQLKIIRSKKISSNSPL